MALTGLLAQPVQQSSAPVAPLAPQQSLGQTIWNSIAKPIGNAVQSGADQLNSTVSNIANNKGNPFKNGLDLLQGLATGAGAAFAPILDPLAKGFSGAPTKGSLMDELNNSPEWQQFANSPAGQKLAKALPVVSEGANVAGTALGLGSGVDEAMNPTPKVPNVTSETPTQVASEDATKIAQDSIKNPLTQNEQIKAVGQGRANIDGLNKSISYEPDTRTVSMHNALQPLAEDGRLQAPTTPENQISNIHATQEEIGTQGQALRDGLSTSDAIWNKNELKGNLNQIELPNVVKSDTALTNQANNFREGVINLAEQADKKAVGLLDLRQGVDNLIQQDFGKNFFDTDKNATALRQYIYSVRDSLNQFAESKLPEGQLPDGTKYTDALKNQSNLINAKDQMSEKFVREYPEGSTNTSRFFKAHPLIRRFGLKTAMGIGGAVIGVSQLNSGVRKTEGELLNKIIGQ